jgi:hypothetical protein
MYGLTRQQFFHKGGVDVKLKKDISNLDFLRLVNADESKTKLCGNCTHHNGECIEFAQCGKCKQSALISIINKNNSYDDID